MLANAAERAGAEHGVGTGAVPVPPAARDLFEIDLIRLAAPGHFPTGETTDRGRILTAILQPKRILDRQPLPARSWQINRTAARPND